MPMPMPRFRDAAHDRARPRRRRRVRLHHAALLAGGLALTPPAGAAVEQAVNEFWPELDVYVRLTEHSRLFFSGSVNRAQDFTGRTEGSFAAAFDLFAAQLPEAWRRALPTMEQSWSLWFRVGYSHVLSIGERGTDEHRLLADATLRSRPMWAGLQLTNRSRVEYRHIDGDVSWRYRNRSRIERPFAPGELLGEHLGALYGALGITGVTPYAMLEFFYDTRVSDWNRRYEQYGVSFDLRDGKAFEVYLALQDTRRAASSSVTALGVVFTFRY
jgi:hypothetical protein